MAWFITLFAIYSRNWTLLQIMLSCQAIRFLFHCRHCWIEYQLEKQEEEEERAIYEHMRTRIQEINNGRT